MERENKKIKKHIDTLFKKQHVVILPPIEAKESMRLITKLGYAPQMTMLDPWYNRGTGGVRADYVQHITEIIEAIKDNTQHFFLWGFPETVARFIERIDAPLGFICWLTWYYKNNPSVIRGWRSSQQACLHYARKEAKMYPEHFFNSQQELRFEEKKMRFVPGPTSVIEEPLLVGFVGKKEQTGHPSQKPEKIYEKLVLMTSKPNDLVFDPMAGSGTLGAVCNSLKRHCILSDISEEYTAIMERRLKVKRISSEILDSCLIEAVSA